MQQVINLVGEHEKAVLLRQFDELAAAVGWEHTAAWVLVGGNDVEHLRRWHGPVCEHRFEGIHS